MGFGNIREAIRHWEVIEIRSPEEAENERGNPVVEVALVEGPRTIETYAFEFITTPNPAGTFYQPGLYTHSEDADIVSHMNDAWIEAAKALAEQYDTRVQASIRSENQLEKLKD